MRSATGDILGWFFHFLIVEQIFQKSTKWSIMHLGDVFGPEKLRSATGDILGWFFHFLMAEQIFQKSAKWSIMHQKVNLCKKKNYQGGRLAICRVNFFNFCSSHKFLKNLCRERKIKKIDAAYRQPLIFFSGLNTPSQGIIDHLADFWKICSAIKKLKNQP